MAAFFYCYQLDKFNEEDQEELLKTGKAQLRYPEKMNSDTIQVGDIVYLYEGKPVSAIKYKCEVIRGCYEEQNRSEIEHISLFNDVYDEESDLDEKRYFDLRLLFVFVQDDQLKRDNLLKAGLAQNRSTHRLNDAILQYLEKIEEIQEDDDRYYQPLQDMSLDELKKLAEKHSTKHKENTESYYYQKRHYRDPYVAEYARKRADGYCQLCGSKASFSDKQGQPFLEVHHVKWLANKGDDAWYNVVALCPNCHRKMHIVDDPKDVKKLKAIAEEKV